MLNLGTIQFGLAIDTRALDAARNRIQNFGQTVAATQRAANRGLETNIQAFRRQENAMLSGMERLKNAAAQISKANIAPRVQTELLTRANRLFNDLTKNIGQAGKAADSTKFDRSVNAYRTGINDLIRELRTMSRVQQSASSTSEAAILKQSNAYERAAERVRNLNAQIERSRLNVDSKTRLTTIPDNALAGLKGNLLGGGALGAREYSAALNDFNKRLGDTRRQFQAANVKANDMTASMEAMRNNIRSLGSGFLLLNGHLGGMSTRMFALSTIASNTSIKIAAIAAAATGFGLAATAMTRGAITTTIQLEKASKALEAIHGNTIEASQGMDFVRKVSDQAGVSFSDAAKGWARYVAASKVANQSMQETQYQFQVISNAAGRLSLSVEDTQGVLKALEQIMSKGKLQAEELRGQLGDRLPGAFGIAAKAMGVTTAQLSDMTKKGEVLSDDFVPKFIRALQEVYNLDISKPVDTTQASINRFGNSVTFLYEAFANNTGVVNAFKRVLETAAEALDAVTRNMGSIISTLGTVTAVVGGATAGFIALRAVMIGFTIIQSIATWITAFEAAAVGATTATRLWTLATIGLNTAMLANPIGLVAKAIAVLVATLGGAYLGYKAFNGAVKQTSEELGDTTNISLFIEMQKKMRTATDEATASLIKQQQAKLTAARTAMNEERETYRNARNAYKSVEGAGEGQEGRAAVEAFTMVAKLKSEFDAATESFKKSQTALQNQIQAVSGLIDVMNTPMGSGSDSGLAGAVESTGDAAKNNIDSILDLIDAFQAAQDKLKMLTEVGDAKDIELVDDLLDARQELRRLSSEELVMAADALKKAGLFTKDLETSIAALNTVVRTSTEQGRQFVRVWQNIDRDAIDLEGIKKATDFLLKGGDPRKMFLIKAATDAEDALRKLDSPRLEGIRVKLEKMGYAGKTAQEALAKFFATKDSAEGLVNVLNDVANAQEVANDRIRDAAVLATAYSKNAWVGQSAEKVVRNMRVIEEFRRQLEALGQTGPEVEAMLQKLYTSLSNADEAEEGLDRIKKKAEELQQSLYGMADSFASNIMEVVQGLKSLQEAITDTLMQFVLDTAENALKDLFHDVLDNIMGKGKKSRNQAEAIKQNIDSLDKNTQALLDLVNALGGMATAGSAGLLGSVAGAIGDAAGGGKKGDFIGGAIKSLGSLFGRAGGGPVTAGKAYRVSEQGAGDEIFFPGTSGTVMPTSKMGGSTSVSYDGRTYIDARGATQETINDLKATMAERDARLRAEIPYLVDNRVQDSQLRGRYANS